MSVVIRRSIDLPACSHEVFGFVTCTDNCPRYVPVYESASIVRRDIGSGDERTIAGGLTFESLTWGSGRVGWADSSYVYFVTGLHVAERETLSRGGRRVQHLLAHRERTRARSGSQHERPSIVMYRRK